MERRRKRRKYRNRKNQLPKKLLHDLISTRSGHRSHHANVKEKVTWTILHLLQLPCVIFLGKHILDLHCTHLKLAVDEGGVEESQEVEAGVDIAGKRVGANQT